MENIKSGIASIRRNRRNLKFNEIRKANLKSGIQPSQLMSLYEKMLKDQNFFNLS